MPRIYIPLRQQTLEALRRLAHEERRSPREQAALVLERAVLAALEELAGERAPAAEA